MAEDAVQCEPVSDANSLRRLEHQNRRRGPETAFNGFAVEFPMQWNREFLCRNRQCFAANREFSSRHQGTMPSYRLAAGGRAVLKVECERVHGTGRPLGRNTDVIDAWIPRDRLVNLELREGTVVADRVGETPCVFLAGLHRSERTIAERLTRLANGALPWPWIDADKALPWVEQRIGLALAESQVAAIRIALISKVLVMTGGPGVGKTTIIKAVLRILAAKGTNLLLCAPTGRAAKRMTEATGFEAKTIHRLLEVDPKGGGFKRGDHNPLDCDLLLVDEASMVDVMLMQALMKAVPDKAALLIVGDIDQLPSVGPGQVLADLISSGAVPVVRLTEVFRQAAQSRIITSAHRINQGSIPDLSPRGTETDFYFVQADDPETAVARIIELVKTLIPKRFGLDPIRDVQVLCPMNRGGVGARSLNIELQAALNPAGDRNTGVTRGKKLVVLVGQKKAVAIGRRRWSKLHEWLLAR